MRILLCLAVCLTVVPAQAKTFYPMIYKISPAAVPVGQSIECEVGAEHGWFAPTQVLVTGSGVTGEVLPQAAGGPVAKDGAKPEEGAVSEIIKVRFTASSDARPGIRDVRIMTARGPSTLGQILVVRAPLVCEAASNNTLESAQAITLPATVCGGIESNEDVDLYRFQVAANTELTFNMHCQRLQQKLGPLAYHVDPILTLRNASGTVLAASDNFFGSDPCLNYKFASAGDYFLEVRDVRYVGYRHWVYAVEIDSRPFVLQTVPGVVAPGVPTTVKLLGFNLPSDAALTLVMPSDAPDGLQSVAPNSPSGGPIDPVLPVYVSRLPTVAEKPASNDTFETAQAVAGPAGISGVLEQADDVDCYAFDLHQGDRMTFAVVARSVGSLLDSSLRILNAKGEVLLENDDFSDKTGNSDCRNEITHPDSRIADWKAPGDGRFVVEIRDTHLRGGERFTYFLEARPHRPGFHLELDSDKSILAPGVSTTLFVRAFREEGFDGPINLAVEGLPARVAATCGTIPASGQDACIFLKAAEDAPRGGCANIRVVGEALLAGPDGGKLTAAARPFQELRRDGGARYMVPVEMHTVGVADVLDLKGVRSSETVLALKPGETRTVDVTFVRTPGFKEPVTLTAVHFQHVWVFGRCMPHSITVDERASKLRIVGDEVKGTVVLKVAPDAKPAEPRLVPLMANVAVNFSLKMIYCGDPILLSIEAPK